MSRQWYWGMVGGAGALIHFGTAILRLNTFFPSPKLRDFETFYAGAWAIRLGVSPYRFSPEFVETMGQEMGLSVRPSSLLSPPLWAWLLQPTTFFSFSTAAVIWLLLMLALITWSAIILANDSGYREWKRIGMIFLIVLTFGPIFLTLTLGQASLFLLIATLLMGRTLRARAKDSFLPAALSCIPAVGAKLFPLFWLGALPLLRRWRLFVFASIFVLLLLGLSSLLVPDVSQDYWRHYLPKYISYLSKSVRIDDQCLGAWLIRLGGPHIFRVHGLSPTEFHTVTWSPPWSINPEGLRWGGYFLAAFLALVPLAVMFRASPADKEGAFYLWVLYGLLLFPHMDRYNHVLLLPAMAWLWRRGEGGQDLVVLAYFLVGLSRLNHLWAILLPAPWGPLASGFGPFAVLLLGGGMVVFLWPSKQPFPVLREEP